MAKGRGSVTSKPRPATYSCVFWQMHSTVLRSPRPGTSANLQSADLIQLPWILRDSARAPGDGEAAFARQYRDGAAADDHGGLLDVEV